MYFTYDGVSSQEFGIKIKKEGINNFSSPQRSYEAIQVKGRNGDLIIDNGNFENFTLEIECYLDSRESDLNTVSKELKKWLISDLKYKKLILSTDTNYYYEAICVNKIDISEVIENFGECLIVFSCKPLKKETFGDDKIILTENSSLHNNGLASSPYIKVVGSGDITININNQKLVLKGVESYIEVDTELYNCFKDNINQNNKMYSDFPIFEEGKNDISWEGNVSQLEILPRWVVL